MSLFHTNPIHLAACGPVASKHGNQISLLNAGSMAIGLTTGRQRHGVGKGRERELRTGETGNGNGTATGEGGESGGGKGYVINDDGCFIFLKNIRAVDREIFFKDN